MDICIHKKKIGYDKHILVSGEKFCTLSSLPKEDLILGCSDEEAPKQSIDTLLELNGFSVPNFPEEKFIKSMSYVTSLGREEIPWQHILPKKYYVSKIKELTEKTVELISNSKQDYYQNIYSVSKNVLNSLQPANINNILLTQYLLNEKNNSNKATLQTFKENKVSQYNRNTKTGRLKITSGGNILRLKKEYRNILKSKFTGGTIYYLDYISLEPRATLAINRPELSIPRDIYTHILKSLNVTNVSRQELKTTVLAQLYGAGEESHGLKTIENSKDFAKLISDFFGIENLKKNIISTMEHETLRNGFYNIYGRWINCIDVKPYMFINYFIQSVAVDIAMLGFAKIIELIGNSKHKFSIIPLFVLHDALILDAAPGVESFLNDLVEVGSNIDKFPNVKFYLEFKKLNEV